MSEIAMLGINPIRVKSPKTNKSVKKQLASKNIIAAREVEKKKEKKNHTLLKMAIGLTVATGAYVLLKRIGADSKIKDYVGKLKDKVTQLIKSGKIAVETATTNGTKVVPPKGSNLDKAARKAKEVAESINKPFSTSAAVIDANLGVGAVTKSAQESAKVFEQAGLTSTEKALQKAEQQVVKNTRYPYYYVDQFEAEMAQKLKARQVEQMWKNYNN